MWDAPEPPTKMPVSPSSEKTWNLPGRSCAGKIAVGMGPISTYRLRPRRVPRRGSHPGRTSDIMLEITWSEDVDLELTIWACLRAWTEMATGLNPLVGMEN